MPTTTTKTKDVPAPEPAVLEPGVILILEQLYTSPRAGDDGSQPPPDPPRPPERYGPGRGDEHQRRLWQRLVWLAFALLVVCMAGFLAEMMKRRRGA